MLLIEIYKKYVEYLYETRVHEFKTNLAKLSSLLRIFLKEREEK